MKANRLDQMIEQPEPLKSSHFNKSKAEIYDYLNMKL